MMKEMASKKAVGQLDNVIAGIDDTEYNWDSFETMTAYYNAEIQKANESLNKLSVMEDAREIINLCNKIKTLKAKLKNCR